MSFGVEEIETCRSLLFVPANEPRFIAKAHERGAGAIILDLEDAIAPDRKVQARANVPNAAEELRRNGVAHVLVRINAASVEDIEAAVAARADAIVLPKPDLLEEIAWAHAALSRAERSHGLEDGRVRMLVLVETPAAILNAASFAGHERVDALILGTEDLSLALGVEPSPESMSYAASAVVFAARSQGKVPLGVPGSLASITDAARFDEVVRLGQKLGMAGTVCIHPKQAETVNARFAPTPETLAQAQRVLLAFDEAQRAGKGAVMFDGKMLDLPIVERARRTVAAARSLRQERSA